MQAPSATIEQYRVRQERTQITNREIQALWGGMGSNWEASWRHLGPQIVGLLAFAQYQAAMSAVDYVPAVLDETGQDLDDSFDVVPEAFAGLASDGRPLDSLAYQAVPEVRLRDDASALVEVGA
jgi:hypothetical protein